MNFQEKHNDLLESMPMVIDVLSTLILVMGYKEIRLLLVILFFCFIYLWTTKQNVNNEFWL